MNSFTASKFIEKIGLGRPFYCKLECANRRNVPGYLFVSGMIETLDTIQNVKRIFFSVVEASKMWMDDRRFVSYILLVEQIAYF